MILGHWQIDVWADGSWVPETWGVFVPPPPIVGTGPARDDRARAQALYEWRERQRGGVPVMAATAEVRSTEVVPSAELAEANEMIAADDDDVILYILGGF